jgi:hypothetical protein
LLFAAGALLMVVVVAGAALPSAWACGGMGDGAREACCCPPAEEHPGASVEAACCCIAPDAAEQRDTEQSFEPQPRRGAVHHAAITIAAGFGPPDPPGTFHPMRARCSTSAPRYAADRPRHSFTQLNGSESMRRPPR